MDKLKDWVRDYYNYTETTRTIEKNNKIINK